MTTQPQPALNPLAEAANATIKAENAMVFDVLSERGKRFFFPAKGILAQGAEAKQKASVSSSGDQLKSTYCLSQLSVTFMEIVRLAIRAWGVAFPLRPAARVVCRIRSAVWPPSGAGH